MRDDAGRGNGQADEQAEPSGTAGVAAWRFAPLALIACALVLRAGRWAGTAICRWPGWPTAATCCAAYVDANYLLSALVFVVLYVAGDGAFLSGRFPADDLRRFPVRLAAGRRPRHHRRHRPARACCSSRRAPLSAASCATGQVALPQDSRRASRRMPSPICWCCGLPLSFRSSWSTSRRRCAACGRRCSWRRPSIGILPGALAYSWLGQGLDSVLLAAKAAGRDASIHDLVTPEITIAFAGPRPCRAARRRRKTPLASRAS